VINAPLYAFLVFSVCILLATGAGLALSRAMPWSEDARHTGLARAVGVALGPFLFGMASVLALGVFRGAAHSTHLAVVFSVLAGTAALVFLVVPRPPRLERSRWQGLRAAEWPLVGAILFSVLALLFISLFVPLTQNDALEYALAARELNATRDLLSYPVLNPETNLTGFFGPWTHPPLYVAMLYMAEVIQGHAESPGLIRLVSPWFMLCGAIVAYALGSFVNRAVGLLACLLFLSPPLFFLGAGSALLDPLPVLGFTLILAAVIGLKARPVVFGALIGALLGLALWTHSQAILFVPLALAAIGIERGARDWRGLFAAAVALICIAALVGAWPYWRNMMLFGSPISDNPAVFAMPELHWDDYFSINRGLNNPTAMLQYGILKGWFALESYGFIFWGMTVGVLFFLIGNRLTSIRILVLDGARAFGKRDSALWLMAGLLLVYISGVVLSVALGIDHMVKNERYLLVILPMVSVFCAYGYMRMVRFSETRSRFLDVVFSSFISIVLVLQVSVFTSYRMAKHGMGIADAFAETHEKLVAAPEYALIEKMNAEVGADGLVLSMKPADMYYAKSRMVSYLDERLLPFYAAEDTSAALSVLTEMGVTHIHVPDYGLPPHYNSLLYSILRDPALSTLQHQTEKGQVYSLEPEKRASGSQAPVSLVERDWVYHTAVLLGGRKGLVKISGSSASANGAEYRGGLPYDLFQRNWSSGITTGAGSPDGGRDPVSELRARPSAQYAVDLSLEGAGLVKITVDQFGEADDGGSRELVQRSEIVTFELSDKQKSREFGFRFMTLSATDSLALSVESIGASRIKIDSADLVEIR
jgi:4-amino-4-deoxy-L-arabinose transferase-like glycosyltransferase